MLNFRHPSFLGLHFLQHSSRRVSESVTRQIDVFVSGRGMTKNRMKARTVIHNYWEKRSDGTIAAERLFNIQFTDLFEALVDQMSELPLPRKARQPVVRNPLKLLGVPA